MILQELKEHTRLQHEALERLVRPRLGFDGALSSRQDYRVLVEHFWGFYAPLEEKLWARNWADYNFKTGPRHKTPLLRRDLAALGLTSLQCEALPHCADLPNVEQWPQALGCLYVLEGATLGGQIIARHLDRNFGVTEENGGAFFCSYGENIGPMWQTFRVLITSQISSNEDTRLAVEAAQQTFEKFHSWLEKSSVEKVI